MFYFSHETTPDPERITYNRHMHNEYEVLYFLRGDADYVIEGSTYRLRRHDLLLIPPRTYHHLIPLGASTYERFVINFDEESFSPPLIEFLRSARPVYNIEEHPHLRALFEGWLMAKKSGFSKEEQRILVQGNLHTLLLFLSHGERTEAIQPIRHNQSLEVILHYIDEHPTEQHTARSLSTRHFVSTSWIVHSFRQHLGISLQQYVSKKRALYAQRLLRDGTPATEVARICSFDSYTTFYRQYKRIFGHSPQREGKG